MNKTVRTLAYYLCYKYSYVMNRIPMLITSWRPLNHKKVVFESFYGKSYSDSPKAISEKLHERYPEFDIIWGMNNIEKASTTVPPYVRVVRYGTFSWYKERTTALAWVDNMTLKNGVLKRRGQKYIQTWHGDRGFKKIATDSSEIEKYKIKNRFRKLVENDICDLFTVGSDFAENVVKSAFLYNGRIIKSGLPRNDCLINPDVVKCDAIRKALNIDPGVRIVLFAPTYKDFHTDSKQDLYGLNLIQVINQLEAETGDQWMVIQRGHIGAKLDDELLNGSDGKIIDLTKYDDMADLLMISDILISDYSSCAGDFPLTGRMTILYLADFENYTKNSRKLYFNIEDSPFFVAHNQAELSELLKKVDDTDLISQNASDILAFYGTHETGHAADDVVDFIVSGGEK